MQNSTVKFKFEKGECTAEMMIRCVEQAQIALGKDVQIKVWTYLNGMPKEVEFFSPICPTQS